MLRIRIVTRLRLSPAELPEQSQRVSYVKDLVHALPLPNYNTMELLCKHLCR